MTALNFLFYITMVAIIYSIVMVYQDNQRSSEAARLELISLIERSETLDLGAEQYMQKREGFSLFHDIQFEEDVFERVEELYGNSSEYLGSDDELSLNLIGEGKPRTYREEAVKTLADYRLERDSMTA